MAADGTLRLTLRRRELGQDAGGHSVWREVVREQALPASQAALLLCDVWDRHWCRGATERMDAMVARMDRVVRAARSRGVQVIHAPSDTMDFYAETPARRRALDAPHVDPPPPLEHPDPPLPIDASDGGSDTGEKPWHKAWSRQHPAIQVDPEKDAVSDRGQEVYNLLCQRGVRNLLLMGVHTNMCVLARSFGIKQMVRWGIHPILIRDLTDTMYNPALPPYVNHDEGTRLVVEFIEKFWCPTILSEDLLRET